MSTDQITRLLGRRLRNRAMVANALCALAQEEYHAGQEERATKTIQTARTVLHDIWVILTGEVSAVSGSDLREVSDLLAGLEARIDGIEKAIGPQTIH